jgi:DNA (cytosine-5)-methyltransferase 1
MINIPIEKVTGNDIPKSDLWVATLDCTDFSKLASTKKEYQTMHLFVHLLRIFYEKKKEDRPNSILIENVPEFEKIAGNILKLCFQEEGYEVNMKKLNSLEFGSRTKRERLFFFASIFQGFKFPEKTGEMKTPILQDGKITLESLNFKSPSENKTLNYYIKRDCKTHNHKFKTIDITKDSYFETIVKQHSKGKASNWIKHPTEEKYAYIEREEHLKYLHDIPEEYYLGTSVNSFSEAIGQSVCGKTYSLIIETVYRFISNCFGAEKQLKFEF